jgi:putative membrane protein
MGYLSQADHEIVSNAVAQAELTTSGEIVTVLADRSDEYNDVVLVWAAALAF